MNAGTLDIHESESQRVSEETSSIRKKQNVVYMRNYLVFRTYSEFLEFCSLLGHAQRCHSISM